MRTRIAGLPVVPVALAALIIALVLAGALSWWRLTGDADGLSRGPMVIPLEHGYSVSMPNGSTFTDGFEILRLEGDQPAVIEAVEIDGDEALELVGVKLAPPPRENAAVQLMEGWPPIHDALDESTFVDAVGATIQPKSSDPMGYELLIGMKVNGEGFLVRDSVIVTYRIGEIRHQVIFPAVVAVCTGPEYEKRNGRCPFPDQAGS